MAAQWRVLPQRPAMAHLVPHLGTCSHYFYQYGYTSNPLFGCKQFARLNSAGNVLQSAKGFQPNLGGQNVSSRIEGYPCTSTLSLLCECTVKSILLRLPMSSYPLTKFGVSHLSLLKPGCKHSHTRHSHRLISSLKRVLTTFEALGFKDASSVMP